MMRRVTTRSTSLIVLPDNGWYAISLRWSTASVTSTAHTHHVNAHAAVVGASASTNTAASTNTTDVGTATTGATTSTAAPRKVIKGLLSSANKTKKYTSITENPLARWSNGINWDAQQCGCPTIIHQRSANRDEESYMENKRITERIVLPIAVGLEGCNKAFNATNSVRTALYFGACCPPAFLGAESAKDILSLQHKSQGGNGVDLVPQSKDNTGEAGEATIPSHEEEGENCLFSKNMTAGMTESCAKDDYPRPTMLFGPAFPNPRTEEFATSCSAHFSGVNNSSSGISSSTTATAITNTSSSTSSSCSATSCRSSNSNSNSRSSIGSCSGMLWPVIALENYTDRCVSIHTARMTDAFLAARKKKAQEEGLGITCTMRAIDNTTVNVCTDTAPYSRRDEEMNRDEEAIAPEDERRGRRTDAPSHSQQGPQQGLCVLMGDENKGVSGKRLADADLVVFIPQFGTISSLNVVTTLGLALFYAWMDLVCPQNRELVTVQKIDRMVVEDGEDKSVGANGKQGCDKNPIPIDIVQQRIRQVLSDYFAPFQQELPMCPLLAEAENDKVKAASSSTTVDGGGSSVHIHNAFLESVSGINSSEGLPKSSSLSSSSKSLSCLTSSFDDSFSSVGSSHGLSVSPYSTSPRVFEEEEKGEEEETSGVALAHGEERLGSTSLKSNANGHQKRRANASTTAATVDDDHGCLVPWDGTSVWNNIKPDLDRVDSRPIHPLFYRMDDHTIGVRYRQFYASLESLCRPYIDSMVTREGGTGLLGKRVGGHSERRRSLASLLPCVLYENDFDQRNLGGLIRNANAFMCPTVYYVGKKKINIKGAVGCNHYTPPIYLGKFRDSESFRTEAALRDAAEERRNKAILPSKRAQKRMKMAGVSLSSSLSSARGHSVSAAHERPIGRQEDAVSNVMEMLEETGRTLWFLSCDHDDFYALLKANSTNSTGLDNARAHGYTDEKKGEVVNETNGQANYGDYNTPFAEITRGDRKFANCYSTPESVSAYGSLLNRASIPMGNGRAEGESDSSTRFVVNLTDSEKSIRKKLIFGDDEEGKMGGIVLLVPQEGKLPHHELLDLCRGIVRVLPPSIRLAESDVNSGAEVAPPQRGTSHLTADKGGDGVGCRGLPSQVASGIALHRIVTSCVPCLKL